MTEPDVTGAALGAGRNPISTVHAGATPDNPDSRDPSLILSSEHLVVDTEWVESGRVRLRREIVSETRTVEIVVRREVLVIDVQDVAPGPIGESFVGTSLDGPAVAGPLAADAGPPLVLVLREEVPEIVLRTQVYERVNAEVVTVEQVAVWHDIVRHEEAATETAQAT